MTPLGSLMNLRKLYRTIVGTYIYIWYRALSRLALNSETK